MIYVPVDVNGPIQVSKHINVQGGLTNNFPEIVFELHDGKEYFDFGDDYVISAVVENTDLGLCLFTGTLEVTNPHRGRILCRPSFVDFTMSGINTLTIMCYIGNIRYSFQTTVFVQSSFVLLKKRKDDINVETVSFIVTINPEDFESGEYIIKNQDINNLSEIHVTVPNNISIDEYDALAFANIVPESQSNGQIKLKLLGKTPSIPIRLKVVIRNDLSE